MLKELEKAVSAVRKPEYPVDPQFVNRWSPRAMSGEEISEQELMILFEAAKWAPSSSNSQPWRFIYAKRNTPPWKTLFDLMLEFNQSWTKNAAVLLVMISKKNFEHNGKFSRTHSFDTGSAWMSLALQGSLMGLVVHGMAGFDYDRAKKDLNIPDDFHVEAMAVVGRPGRKEDLPPPLQEREVPSTRKKVSEIVFEGRFGAG
jgi:nitroreductase